MPDVKLSKEQLEGLDLMISAKKLNPHFVNWVDVVQVTVDVVTVTVGAAVSKIDPAAVKAALSEFEKMPVEKLIEIRNHQR